MRLVRLLLSHARISNINEHTPMLDHDRIGRNGVIFEPWFPASCFEVKSPLMPWADHVFTLKLALAKRTAYMVARRGQRSEFSISIYKRVSRASDGDGLHRPAPQHICIANVLPI
jgi:hypothetical protein